MNAINGYFTRASKNPSKKGDDGKESTTAPAMEMSITPPSGLPIPAPIRTPLKSRPSSIFPEGDFRNAPPGEHPRHQGGRHGQLASPATAGETVAANMSGEGVVLKKVRDNFTCSPPMLRNEAGGLFDQVSAMNVRVSLSCQLFTLIVLTVFTCAP
jgi:hypothetical protein